MLLIDPRAGSNKLAEKFDEGEYQMQMLEFGDVCFDGNGPEGRIKIGVEYKKVADIVQCIQDGRFAGYQMRGMIDMYDISMLLIEGNYQPDWQSGRVMIPHRGGNGLRFGLPYSAFDNFLTQVTVHACGLGRPFIVKKSMTSAETVQIIRDLFKLYDKPWDEHTSMRRPNRTKLLNVTVDKDLLDTKPGDADYPQAVLRKSLTTILGVSWEKAGQIAAIFGNVEALMAASQKDLESLEGLGPTLAARIFEALHGYPDPTRKIKKRKKEINGTSADR